MRNLGVYLSVWLATACLLLAQENSAPGAKKTPVDDKAVRGLIRQLGDTSFDVREAAQKRLADIGEPALELLKSSAKENADFEVRQRLEQLIKTIIDSFFVEVRSFDRFKGFTHRLAVTPDSQHVVAISNGALRCLNLADGKETVEFDFPQAIRNSWGFGLAPDGGRVIVGSDDQVGRVYDVKTGKLINELKGHKGPIYGAALHPDGKRAITGAGDMSLRVWDVNSGVQIRSFENVPDHVQALMISPDGKLVAAAHSIVFQPPGAPATVILWDFESGKQIRSLDHPKRVCCVRFSADGKTLLTSCDDANVRLWNVADGKLLKTFARHTDRVEGASFTPDGKRVISVGDQNNPFMIVWDIATGETVYQSASLNAGFMDVAALADGRHCVTSGKDGAIRVWQWKR